MTVAELTVKLGVQGQGQITSALEKTKQGLQSVAQTASATASAITGSLGGLAVAGGIAGFGMLGKSAFDSAVSFETLNARLTAITGSGAKAAQVLDMVRKVAGPSPFTFSQLADAAVGLQALGLETNAMLPRLANLGAAFGADEEHLKSLVNMFGKFSVGQMPDIEQLSMFGMSRSQFAKMGIKFDTQGALESGQEAKLFDTFIKMIDSKYSTMMQQLAGTTSTKLASLADQWESGLRVIGQKMITILTPYIKYITDFLGRMIDSGALASLVEKFFGPMADFTKGFTDGNVQASVDKLLASIVAVAASIPDILQKTFQNLGTLLENIFSNIQGYMTKKDLGQFGEYQRKKENIGWRELFGVITHEQMLNEQKALDRQYGMNAPKNIMEGVDFGKPFADAKTFMQEILGKMAGTTAQEVGNVVEPFGPYKTEASTAGNEIAKAGAETNDLLLRISNNTKETADTLTMRRQTIGGGRLGMLGLSGAESKALDQASKFGPGIIPAGTDMERAMRRMIRDESRRNGTPGIMRRF